MIPRQLLEIWGRIPRRRIWIGLGILLLSVPVVLLDEGAREFFGGTPGWLDGDEPTLKVLTRPLASSYYIENGQPAGPEYDLVNLFAESIGVTPEFIVKESSAALFEALRAGEGHLAAAAISETEARVSGMRFGPAYHSVDQLVVCHRDVSSPLPRGPDELVGLRVHVAGRASHEAFLKTWREQHPDLNWERHASLSSEKLLAKVAAGEADCTLVDSATFALNRRHLPQLASAFVASAEESLTWVLADGQWWLGRRLRDWLHWPGTAARIAAILNRYLGPTRLFDHVDFQVYKRRIRKRLPQYRALFERVADEHDLPWTLIAAQAYQESHWDPQATSPTGVRGLMMLTRNTAESLGVADRLDPVQSVEGGVRYLKQMLARLPETIHAADRMWFALAAYTIGAGHLDDARGLAAHLGRNPDSWHALEETLPLLAEKRYAGQLRFGSARGADAVRYVHRIRNYNAILKRALAQGSL